MPVDMKAIAEQLAAIGEADHWWERRELRDLPGILGSEERILAITTGRLLERFDRLRPGRPWLLLVTTHRVLCLKSSGRYGRRQLDVPTPQITAISQGSRFFSVTITLVTQERRHRIRIRKSKALKFIGALSALVYRIASLPAPAGQSPLLPGLVQAAELAKVEDRVEQLEDEMEQLRRQLQFLEDLMRRRQTGLPLASSTAVGVLEQP